MQCCSQIPWLTSTMKEYVLFPVMKLLKSCYPAELLQILKLLYPAPPPSFTHHFIAQLTAKHASGSTVHAIELEIPCFRTELSLLTQQDLTQGDNSWRQKLVTKHPGDTEANTGCGADKTLAISPGPASTTTISHVLLMNSSRDLQTAKAMQELLHS